MFTEITTVRELIISVREKRFALDGEMCKSPLSVPDSLDIVSTIHGVPLAPIVACWDGKRYGPIRVAYGSRLIRSVLRFESGASLTLDHDGPVQLPDPVREYDGETFRNLNSRERFKFFNCAVFISHMKSDEEIRYVDECFIPSKALMSFMP